MGLEIICKRKRKRKFANANAKKKCLYEVQTMPTRRVKPRTMKYRLRRRRVGRGRMYRRRPQNVYYFKRTKFLQNAISVGNSSNYSVAWGIRLSDLPDSTDFTNLYDEYQITKCVFKFIPKFSQVNVESANLVSNSILTQFMSAIDYDDSSNLPVGTAIDAITQYQSFKMTRGHRTHTRTFYPKIELSGTSLSAPKWRQWIDCDNPSALHNGLKVVIPQLNGLPADTFLYWDAQLTVYMKFRNVL